MVRQSKSFVNFFIFPLDNIFHLQYSPSRFRIVASGLITGHGAVSQPLRLPSARPHTLLMGVDVTDPKYSEDFLKIWNVYPRKVGKLAAFRAFERLGCHNGDVELIMDSIDDHLDYDSAWRRERGKFIPHLATFLNQRRFEDEI